MKGYEPDWKKVALTLVESFNDSVHEDLMCKPCLGCGEVFFTITKNTHVDCNKCKAQFCTGNGCAREYTNDGCCVMCEPPQLHECDTCQGEFNYKLFTCNTKNCTLVDCWECFGSRDNPSYCLRCYED